MSALALTEALALLGEGRDLTADQAGAAVAAIMSGEASEAAIAAFLTALRFKGETADELAGAVGVVRSLATGWPARSGSGPPLLDTCGTGGDGACSLNVSTAAAIVAAACGVPVAKHGNRSASGNSGSAEVLAVLGVEFDAEPALAAQCLSELGITFLFAPRYHPAARFAAPVRKQLPFRTLFNLVGPLANPARPEYQLLGVASDRHAELVAGALARLGIGRAAVVTGADGMDEVTLSGPTRVRWVEGQRMWAEEWTPDRFRLPAVETHMLRVAGPAESAAKLRALLAGKAGPCRDVVLANVAAALRVAGRVDDLAEGVARGAAAIDSGAAAALLERWAQLNPRRAD